MTNVLITGAGGFIGHHLATYLARRPYRVSGADIKSPDYGPSGASEFHLLDLRRFDNCLTVTRGAEEIYHLAADMGGIGYISAHHAALARNNALIDLHMLEAARLNGVRRLLFASSACVYPQYLQNGPNPRALKETDAWPADPEAGYGLEKLFSEKLCEYYRNEFGLETRVVRFHNVYGPWGAYEGGREKAPAAVCRKIALAEDGGTVQIWGDGNQSRSFMYIDDCVEGMHRVMRSDYHQPLNLGRDELVTINQLFDIVAGIAKKRIRKQHDVSKPQGVRGRNSDNEVLRRVLNWEPGIDLQTGLERTYAWIASQVQPKARVAGCVGVI
jgi:GDP-D-mannose 3', 5'-epimerase